MTELIIRNSNASIAVADATTNVTLIDVIGNKTDASNITADQASLIGLLRYIVANINTDADVLALLGALDTAAAIGAVDNATEIMGYIKQLVTQLLATDIVADAILVDTNELQGDWTNGGRLDLILDEITVQGDTNETKLDTIDGLLDVPTEDLATDTTINQVIGKKSDTIAGTSLVAIAKQIIVDTGTDIPALIGTPVTDLATDIAANQTDLDAIIVGTITNATGADVASDIVALDTIVDAEVVKDTASRVQTATVTTVDASVTPWTVAAHKLFTVSGIVEIDKIFAVVNETVVEGVGADNTVSIGTADDVDVMIGATVGDALVTNDLWANVAGTSTVKQVLVANDESFIVSGTDIDIDVLGSNSITDGTLTFYCTWKPISIGATVAAAIWD